MMKTTFRFGWLAAVLTLAALASACGALGQAPEARQTAQRTASGASPDDIPVYPDSTDFSSDEAGVGYSTTADFKTVTAFYVAEMPKNGWAEAEEPAELGEMTILVYEKDSREATVAIQSASGQTFVIIGIEKK